MISCKAGGHTEVRQRQPWLKVNVIFCMYTHIWDSSCPCMRIWMENFQWGKRQLDFRHAAALWGCRGSLAPLSLTSFSSDCHMLKLLTHQQSAADLPSLYVFGKQKKDTNHTGCILILLFFLFFFFSTLRASFEQLKERKSIRVLNRLCCYFCHTPV